MDNKDKPIGFFDSGVGGLSVMKEAISIMPNENFVYFGDSKNAPYGTKELEEVKKLTLNAVDFLLDKNVKAIVIACNTATSAAIEDIRDKYSSIIPIIGIEPALKPAVKLNRKGNVIIMATPMTLKEKKFKALMEKYRNEASIISLPCAGLVEFIEQGVLEGEELETYLKEKFKEYLANDINSVVLGCTHYPFVKNALSNVVGSDIPLIDGGEGTAKELKRKLKEKDLINDSKEKGNIVIYNSLNDNKIIDFCYNLINL
ncbi:glutamate racemase [Clostridium sp. YIM B02555]|uniref:glutamate racemase n=1 Tax=Clostridium sp. YIM B02555 TaxID=2911968 RepID=UPI001EEDDD90|nr:glutamate racemase [Clostridium sp. YIM B02555]